MWWRGCRWSVGAVAGKRQILHLPCGSQVEHLLFPVPHGSCVHIENVPDLAFLFERLRGGLRQHLSLRYVDLFEGGGVDSRHNFSVLSRRWFQNDEIPSIALAQSYCDHSPTVVRP